MYMLYLKSVYEYFADNIKGGVWFYLLFLLPHYIELYWCCDESIEWLIYSNIKGCDYTSIMLAQLKNMPMWISSLS